MNHLSILKNTNFFTSLSETDQFSFIENIRLDYFPADHLLFTEGDFSDKMFVIRSGQIKIYKQINNCEQTLDILEKNDFFGEMGLVANLPRNANAKTIEESELFIIYKKDLKELFSKKTTIAENITEFFVKRTNFNKQITLKV